MGYLATRDRDRDRDPLALGGGFFLESMAEKSPSHVDCRAKLHGSIRRTVWTFTADKSPIHICIQNVQCFTLSVLPTGKLVVGIIFRYMNSA